MKTESEKGAGSGVGRLDLRLFGAPRLRLEGADFIFRAPERAMLLLAYLITARREVARKSLAFALWPDERDEVALANLRRHLQLLEAAMPPAGAPYLEKNRVWVRWSAWGSIVVDTTNFEDLSRDPSRFDEAVALYAGDFFEATENEWAVSYRRILRERQFEMLGQLVARYRSDGEPKRALEHAERRYRMDDWREDTLRDVMALRFDSGDRAGALAEYVAFRARMRDELGVDPATETTALYARIADEGSSGRSLRVTLTQSQVKWTGGSPYRGLRPFDAEHGSVFFGRGVERGEIVKRLRRGALLAEPIVLVLGASGAGKSSVVRAGVVPDLTIPGLVPEVRSWSTRILAPSEGLDAVTALVALTAAAEADSSNRLLVVVDQLEELFTGAAPVRATKYFEELEHLMARGRTWLILTMRSDFYQYISEFNLLRRLAESDRTYLLSTIREEHLGQVISGPAGCAGAGFEVDEKSGVGLDEVIRCDAEGPGRLPLLEFALDELFLADIVRAGGNVMTFKTYAELGGLAGAIARRAKGQTSEMNRVALEAVVSSLITLRIGEHPTARAAADEEFADPILRAILDDLVQARLVVASGDTRSRTYRLAHEALLTQWDLAVSVIERESEELRALTRLRAADRAWRDGACDDGFLLAPGKPLSEAQRLCTAQRPLSSDVRAFVAASTSRANRLQRQHEVDEKERKRLSSQTRLTRRVAAATGVVALAFSLWGIYASQEARHAYADKVFEEAIVGDHLDKAWADCGKQRRLCTESVERWLNTNMPLISNISSPYDPNNHSLSMFFVSGCNLEFEKQAVNRKSGEIVSRDRESADLMGIESIFRGERGFDGGSTRPTFATLIVQTRGFVRRSDHGYKYFYFNFDDPTNEAQAERNFWLLADLCSDGTRISSPSRGR